MMTLQAYIDWKNVDRALENFQFSLADQSPALGEIADDLREMIAEQFATEGAAGGTPWAPLAASTLPKTRGTRMGILYSTGALYSSLVDAGAPGHVEELDGQQLLFGSTLPYALFHQTGAGMGFGQPQLAPLLPKGNRSASGGKSTGPGRGAALPMRPLIVVTDARAQSWVETVRAQIEAQAPLLGAKELG